MFKFKIDPADIEKTKLLIDQKFYQACNDPAMLQDIGKFTAERIRYQARITKPYNDPYGGQNNSGFFYNLKPSTVGKRKYLAKYNTTDTTYEAARSNLTLTGKFLNSLGFDVTGAGEITLSFKGDHPGYKTKTGRTPSIPNGTLYRYLSDKGFPAFTPQAVSHQTSVISRIKAITRSYLRRALKLS